MTATDEPGLSAGWEWLNLRVPVNLTSVGPWYGPEIHHWLARGIMQEYANRGWVDPSVVPDARVPA